MEIKGIIILEVSVLILSVDFNPLLRRRFELECIRRNFTNITDSISYGPGGDGIELSYFLNALNEKSLVTGFLGGVNGTIISNCLKSDRISNEFLLIKDETSEYIDIYSNDENIHIQSINPRITRDEYEGFMQLFNRLIIDAKMVCIVGELPANIPTEIYFDLILNTNIINKKCLVSIKGKGLKYAIEARPHLLLIDKSQLEEFTNLILDYEYEVIKAGYYIIEKNVNILVISLGNKGSIVLTKESVYRVDASNVEIPENEPHFGYMLGGYALSMERGYDFEILLKLGQACGIVNSFRHKEEIDMSDIKRIMLNIEVTRFNY